MGKFRIAKGEFENRVLQSKFSENARLDLNDLINKRKEEKKIENKTNFLIFSGAAAVVVTIVLILSL